MRQVSYRFGCWCMTRKMHSRYIPHIRLCLDPSNKILGLYRSGTYTKHLAKQPSLSCVQRRWIGRETSVSSNLKCICSDGARYWQACVIPNLQLWQTSRERLWRPSPCFGPVVTLWRNLPETDTTIGLLFRPLTCLCPGEWSQIRKNKSTSIVGAKV